MAARRRARGDPGRAPATRSARASFTAAVAPAERDPAEDEPVAPPAPVELGEGAAAGAVALATAEILDAVVRTKPRGVGVVALGVVTADGTVAAGVDTFGVVTDGVVTLGVVILGVVTVGVVTLGTVTVGVVTLGTVTVGVVTLGTVTVGVVTLGTVTVGVVTLGTVTVGVVILGAVTVGVVTLGTLTDGTLTGGKTAAVPANGCATSTPSPAAKTPTTAPRVLPIVSPSRWPVAP